MVNLELYKLFKIVANEENKNSTINILRLFAESMLFMY